MAFTDVFGGKLIFPSQLSYLSITTAVDVTLQWPTEQQITGGNVVADFIDVDATVAALNIDMPSALVTGTGNKATFNNVGANTFTVRDSTGGTIQSVAPGETWVVVLRDNTTAVGLWRTFQLGANVAVASASALAGAGIKAIGVLLNQQIDSDVEAATPFTVVDGDRAKCLIYTAGAGTANLTAPATLGNDWFCMIRNSGSGTLNVVPAAGQIDGGASLNLDPNDSAFFFTDGTDFFTVGLSSGSTIAFDFVSIPVPGSGDFVLSGVNLDRISYRFTGALTGNRKIVVPNTTQQYWCDNQTTGAFTLGVGTAAQGIPPQITQGETVIFYCDATNVINAVSSTSISFPVLISQGGTGATTVGGAQVNLQVPPDSRLLTAGDGIVGGGDLTADRTFDFNLASITIAVPDLAADFFVFQDAGSANVNRKALLSTIQGVIVQEEGVPLAVLGNILDFVGAGVVASGAGVTKTITIDLVPVSTGASNVLRGDGAGGWVEETSLTIDASGNLFTTGQLRTLDGTLFLADAAGANGMQFRQVGGSGNVETIGVSGGGNINWGTSNTFNALTNWVEKAAASTPVVGAGEVWVRNDVPNTLMFTNDADEDFPLTEEGQFTGTFTGMLGVVNATIDFTRVGNLVFLVDVGSSLGTSNANTLTMTGVPASLRPTSSPAASGFTNCLDNSADSLAALTRIDSSGVLSFLYPTAANAYSTTGWTASGLKGFLSGWSFVYRID